MNKLLMTLALFIVLTGFATGNIVSNEREAIEIAKADYVKTTGEEMDKNYPLKAFLKDGTWIVTISLPPNTLGGGPTIEIDKETGNVIKRYFTQKP
jgi:hypothetical protein